MSSKIIFDPDGFFKGQARLPSVFAPILIALIAALSTSIIPIIVLYYITTISPEGVASYMLIFGITNLLGGILAVFGMWMVTSLILHFAAFYLGGEGTIRNTALLAGWGFLPMIFANISNSVFIYQIINSGLSGVNPESVSIGYVNSMLANHPLMILAKIVSSLGLVWMTFIWTFVIHNTHDLNFRQSALTSMVPTTLIFAYWFIMGF